jgi:hypothetical protein
MVRLKQMNSDGTETTYAQPMWTDGRPNFLIRFRGSDWSGWLSLIEAQARWEQIKVDRSPANRAYFSLWEDR